MPQFYDDDDMDTDLQDGVPEFRDEADFDDYLNDEEYQLMSEMFPRAKKELADYVGWDNLSVKVSIFDHEFNFDEAMIELKRSLKKKKTEEAEPKMSALERLARRRALGGKKTTETVSGKDAEERSKTSLLSALQKKPHGSEQPKSTLATRLAALQKKSTTSLKNTRDEGDGVSKKAITSSGSLRDYIPASIPGENGNSKGSRISLSSRLSALQKAKISVPSKATSEASEFQAQPENVRKAAEEPPKPKNTSFETLISKFSLGSRHDSPNRPNLNVGITKVVLSEEQSHKSCLSRLKRKQEEVFTVFYPDTNNQSAKKQAISNFQKKSPDDVVLEAQKKAFEDIAKTTKGVEEIKISDSKAENEGELEFEDEDDKPIISEPAIRTHKKALVPTKPKKPIDLEGYLQQKKPHLNFVVLGHVDAGKSTLMGRLLYDVGAVDNKLIRKLKKESEMIGKSSFHLAWVMDQTSEERSRGVTVDICTSDFRTSGATFTIVDAPGHRDFVPNAIAGVSQADVAVLSIDCSTDAFESGFNLDGQTKEHALLARSLGVRHLIVAMNKMDSVDWYEGRFEDIKYELRNFFEDIGIKDDQLSWVPCSGLTGEGVYKKEYPLGQTWYKGPSLVGRLEEVSRELQKYSFEDISNTPFIFSILEVTPGSKANEAIVSGRVESGHIQGGETITIYPSEQSVLVDQVLTGNNQTPSPVAIKGDFVSLKLRNAFCDDIQGGDLAAVVGYDILGAQEFSAQILTFNLDRPLLPGTSFMLFRGSCEQPARVKKLVSVVDKSDATKILKKKVRHLGSKQAAIVEIELVEKKRRVPMLTFEENKHLGRIVLRKEGKTIAAGVVKTLEF
ncbi:LAQU0S20e00606g1_1 [Lachancea quebecensis]|uniref:Elongation factor 1 alpha-like protein n=1 Tax=Lachancea quebecensis TaxID=1654605 RepID=A0A0P1KXS5_9SACH|nr:LAQU0S20e00606g1_1 [Lachancea quebecensis]